MISQPSLQLIPKCESKTLAEGSRTIRNHVGKLEHSAANLRIWCQNLGIIYDDRVRIQDTPSFGRGLFAYGGKISKGTIIAKIPLSSAITADNIENDPRLGHAVGPLRSAGLDDRGVIALWLVFQALSKDEKWREYIALLPAPYQLSRNHILLSSDKLVGTPLGVSVEAMKANISRQIRTLMRAIRKLEPPECLLAPSPNDLEQIWTWAHAIVMSRSGILRPDREVNDWTGIPVTIVPFIDFCNHSENPHAEVAVKADFVELIARRDIEEGEEITISYWPTNEKLNCEQSLFTFGFLSDLNKFILPGINFDNPDESPRRAIQRLVFLDRKGNAEGIYLDDIPSAIDYYSIECMTEREVVELAKSLTTEAGVGPRTRRILDNKSESGKLKLLHVITLWEREVAKCKPDSPPVFEYIQRLRDAILSAKKVLDS